MKRSGIVVIILMTLWMPSWLGAQSGELVGDCDAEASAYFWEHQYGLFEDYQELRSSFIATGDYSVIGSELLHLQMTIEEAIIASPACLDGISLRLFMSISDLHNALFFAILAFNSNDTTFRQGFQELGEQLMGRSDEHYQVVAEMIQIWLADELVDGQPPKTKKDALSASYFRFEPLS